MGLKAFRSPIPITRLDIFSGSRREGFGAWHCCAGSSPSPGCSSRRAESSSRSRSPSPPRRSYIPNGVDAGKYRFDAGTRTKLRASLGFDDEQVVGILTRRLVQKNGVIYLARASGLVRDDRLRLVLIGDGPERDDVSATLEKGFAGRFTMLGREGARRDHSLLQCRGSLDPAVPDGGDQHQWARGHGHLPAAGRHEGRRHSRSH